MLTVILAGVGPGMGCSTARYLASKGHKVAMISRSEFAPALASEIGALGSTCDLNNSSDTRNTIHELADQLGNLDSLVHFAGGFYGKEDIQELDRSVFEQTIMNNVGTLFNSIQAAVPIMKERGGTITGISAAKHVYYNGNAAYAAAKGAILFMMKSLAVQLAKFNIRVNTISPGFIRKDDCKEELQTSDIPVDSRYPSRYVAYAVESIISNPGINGEDIAVDSGMNTKIGNA